MKGRRDRRAIESRLALRYRGKSGYRRLLRDATLRISVSGIRGKSGLTEMTMAALMGRGLSVIAKQTGTDPVCIKDGKRYPIQRDPRNRAILGETYWEVKRHWPAEALVLENQAITGYTMRVFNDLYCKPHYVFVTNVRRDHLGDIARTLPRMAKAFANSVPPRSVLVSGERDPDLKAIMETTAKRRGVRFLDAAPGRLVVPGYEAVTILDAMLHDWMGEGLAKSEKRMMLRDLESRFAWQDSSVPGVVWFHGAEINDVDSTQLVIEHMQTRQHKPLTLVAYLRRDRVDRTVSFLPFFDTMLSDGSAERLVLCGHRSAAVANRLRAHRDRVHVLPDTPDSIEQALHILRDHSQGGAVMTVANAVPPWPHAFADAMRVAAPQTEFQLSPRRRGRARRSVERVTFHPIPAPMPGRLVPGGEW